MKRILSIIMALSLIILPSCLAVRFNMGISHSDSSQNSISFTWSEPEYKVFTPEYNELGEPLVILDYELSATDLYYRSLLSNSQREVYDMMAVAIANHEAYVSVRGISEKYLVETVEAYLLDHPEVFYWQGSFSFTEHFNGSTDIEFNYILDKEVTDRYLSDIENAAQEYLSYITADMTQFEAAVIIHDLLVTNITYSEITDNSIPEIHTLFGALVNKSAVCSGYAHAFKYLCNKVGINVLNIVGIANGEDHQWNMVTIDGDSFFVDVTWDDPRFDDGTQMLTYSYFGLTNKELSKTHAITGSFTLPTCKTDKYNYCEKYGFVIDNSDVINSILIDAITFTVNNKPQYNENIYDIFLRIDADACNYEECCDIILDEFPDVMNEISYDVLSFSAWQVTYSMNEQINPYVAISIILD